MVDPTHSDKLYYDMGVQLLTNDITTETHIRRLLEAPLIGVVHILNCVSRNHLVSHPNIHRVSKLY